MCVQVSLYALLSLCLFVLHCCLSPNFTLEFFRIRIPALPPLVPELRVYVYYKIHKDRCLFNELTLFNRQYFTNDTELQKCKI